MYERKNNEIEINRNSQCCFLYNLDNSLVLCCNLCYDFLLLSSPGESVTFTLPSTPPYPMLLLDGAMWR